MKMPRADPEDSHTAYHLNPVLTAKFPQVDRYGRKCAGRLIALQHGPGEAANSELRARTFKRMGVDRGFEASARSAGADADQPYSLALIHRVFGRYAPRAQHRKAKSMHRGRLQTQFNIGTRRAIDVYDGHDRGMPHEDILSERSSTATGYPQSPHRPIGNLFPRSQSNAVSVGRW